MGSSRDESSDEGVVACPVDHALLDQPGQRGSGLDDYGQTDAYALAHETMGMRPSSKRIPFSSDEVRALVAGVEQFGVGNWTAIFNAFEFDHTRKPLDLKDKWRNIHKRRKGVDHVKAPRKRVSFTNREEENIVDGVAQFGLDFKTILQSFKFHSSRSSADLSNKWRLMRIKRGDLAAPDRFIKRFLLLDADNIVFEEKFACVAARKAQCGGFEFARLYEHGTDQVHVFAVDPESTENGGVPKMRKMGIEIITKPFPTPGRLAKDVLNIKRGRKRSTECDLSQQPGEKTESSSVKRRKASSLRSL